MANSKISALTAAAALTGAEQFALVQSATTKVDDLNTIKNFVNVLLIIFNKNYSDVF